LPLRSGILARITERADERSYAAGRSAPIGASDSLT
jgi:hypothetical protein